MRLMGALDPTTLVPIGTVTGMLVAVFVLFIRDSARNDQRADVIHAQMVSAAEADRDRYRDELEREKEEVARLTRIRLRDAHRIYQLESQLVAHDIPIPPVPTIDGEVPT